MRTRMEVLTDEMVLLGAHAFDRTDAIRQAGEVLVKAGCVAPSYVEGMLARERVMSTYLGSGIAIPHGELADIMSSTARECPSFNCRKGLNGSLASASTWSLGLQARG